MRAFTYVCLSLRRCVGMCISEPRFFFFLFFLFLSVPESETKRERNEVITTEEAASASRPGVSHYENEEPIIRLMDG